MEHKNGDFTDRSESAAIAVIGSYMFIDEEYLLSYQLFD